MIHNRKTLLGSALAGTLGVALLCCGAAKAQDYNDDSVAYHSPDNETVTVYSTRHPLGVIQGDRMLGAGNGSLASERLSLSEQVSYSDLDLSRRADFRELQSRVRDTAQAICDRLEPRDPFHGDPDAARQCTITAFRDAMARVPEG